MSDGPLEIHHPDFIVHAWCVAEGEAENCTGNRCGAEGGRRTVRTEAIECPECYALATGASRDQERKVTE